MRWVLFVIGVLCVLVAAVWILQGLYVLRQGFMAGDMKWTYIGICVGAAGIVLVVLGLTLRKKA